MFDIGFWELCLIAVVALLILGPERLPTAARTAGKWIGKIRGMVANVKSEIDRELQLDEIRNKMKEQEEKLRNQSGIDDIKDTLDNTIANLNPMESMENLHNHQNESSNQVDPDSSQNTDDGTKDK